MPRKGENIFKRKDDPWEGRFIKGYENGRAVYGYVFGKTYSEAKKKKSEAMAGTSTRQQYQQNLLLSQLLILVPFTTIKAKYRLRKGHQSLPRSAFRGRDRIPVA